MSDAPVRSEQPIENVWEYPRPPRLEPTPAHVVVRHAGVVLADTRHALRILETSHPPVFYLPPGDCTTEYLKRSARRASFCEWKGTATYWSLELPAGVRVPDVAWSYAAPVAHYAALRDHLAFYASRVDECTVDGERVEAQPGDFYGGWITSHVRGPFKGPPGTLGW